MGLFVDETGGFGNCEGIGGSSMEVDYWWIINDGGGLSMMEVDDY